MGFNSGFKGLNAELDVPFIVSPIRETCHIESKYHAEHPVTVALLRDTIKGTYCIRCC